MVLEFVVNDDGHTGVDLRRHRGPHNLLGKGQCRRLAKLVPSACSDNGTAAELSFGFVEWLSSPILFLDDTVRDMFVYQFLIGLERMGNALDSALAKIKDDAPRSAGVLRAQLRNVVTIIRAAGGPNADIFTVHDSDTYEVAAGAFPTGAGIDDVYDWVGTLRGKHLVTELGSYGVYNTHASPRGPCNSRDHSP